MEPKNTIDIVFGDETGGTNQNQGAQAGGVQETSNQGDQRRLSMMPKVPAHIRRKYNSEDFDPLVASFGPYNVALRNALDQRLAFVEDFKPTAMKWFVSGTGKDENFWLDEVWRLLPDLRRCYAQESLVAYSDAELARLLFQDACLAILVMGITSQESQDIALLCNNLGVDTVLTISRDLFLLENQLPFWFIRDLLRGKFGEFKGEERWRKYFIGLCHGRKSTPPTTTVHWDEEAGEPAHFVEALKIAHLSGWKSENIEHKHNFTEQEEPIVRLKQYYAIHSATELKAKGITVEPNSTNSFKNISFESNCFSGTLRFPVHRVEYGSKAIYTNIIAYEMSRENHTEDYTITAYVHLMKALLQSPQDVEELEAKGIIINLLGSNEQVMNLYRDIYTFGTNCSLQYKEICQEMEDHYNNKTWLAEFLNTYFRTPWTVMALIGSILVVILTFMQTYYAAADANKRGDKGKSPR